MKNRKRIFEIVVHGIFLILGLITVGCVLLITVYLIIAGIPGHSGNRAVEVPVRQALGFHRRGTRLWHSALYPHQRLRYGRAPSCWACRWDSSRRYTWPKLANSPV